MPLNMHSSTPKKLISFNLKTLSAAVASAMLFSGAHAAGLGKLTVLSSLGQPLRAEIELTSVTKAEEGTLVPKLASVEAFREANVDFNPALLSLRFAIEQRGTRHIVRITSAQPINDPFMDLLLEVGGTNGRLVREYTFLLDPADLRNAQNAQVGATGASTAATRTSQTAGEGSQAASGDKSATTAKASTGRRAKAAPPPLVADGEIKGGKSGDYQVKKGDTLSKIAGQLKPEGVSLDQMLVALYRTNSDAFIDNNMNRLRAGQILSVPDSEAIRSVSGTDAKGVIVAQAGDFGNYRDKLAGQVAKGAAQQSGEGKQSARGKIVPKIEETPNAANKSQDKLKVTKAGAAANKSTVSTEELIAKDKALAEAEARVKQLETNVRDLKSALEIKSQELASQQKQAEQAKVTQPVTPVTPQASTPASASAQVTIPPASASASTSVTPPTQATTTPASASATTASVQPAASQAASMASTSVTPPVAETQPKPPSATASASKPPAVKPAPPPEVSFMESLTSNAIMLTGVGALLLVGLGAFGIYSANRKKKQHFEDSMLSDTSLKANSLFGSTGGQNVDTNNSVFNSNFAPSASQLDTNEVDPVAEADVYIAYGRDAQAEEILKEALRMQPERNAVRVKLLEIYATRKDLRAFEILATELYGLTKGAGDDWAQAAALGATLDPNNPLYTSGRSEDGLNVKTVGLTAPTEASDELDLEALLANTQADTSAYETHAAEPPPSYSPPPKAPVQPEAKRPEPVPQPKPPVEDKLESPLDFDLGGFNAPEKTKSANELPRLDLASNDEGSASRASAKNQEASLDFDLSGISLDLNHEETTPRLDLGHREFGKQDDFSANEPANSTEMATKLDLAIAYQEIGDKEGARELLDEVIKGGTADQSEKARSMLAKLA